MKRNIKAALCTTLSAATLAMAMSSAVLAAPAAENNKLGGDNVAIADVAGELLIRKSASENAEVIGYIPSGAGVIMESLNEGWTKVTSGGITGYVKTDYLEWGENAAYLKSVYGVQGAVAAWDDVKIFSDHEDTSSVIGSLNEGEGFEVVGSTEDWVEVQLDNGQTAYIAVEDVKLTTVLETAVSTDEYVAPAVQNENTAISDGQYAEQTEWIAEDTYYETEWVPETEYYVPDNSYMDQTDWSENDSYYYETEWVPETEYTESTEWTDNTYYETEWVPETEYVEETDYVEDEYYEEDDDDYYDESYDDTYIDPETEAGVSASASDVDLLAALIYCEAGNQSMEGKIAVGQVVMNRVASSSFANTISGVIYESGQFTPAMTGWLDSVIGSAPSDCYDAAMAALAGEGSVPGCLYFNAGSGKGTQIGDHQFY